MSVPGYPRSHHPGVGNGLESSHLGGQVRGDAGAGRHGGVGGGGGDGPGDEARDVGGRVDWVAWLGGGR